MNGKSRLSCMLSLDVELVLQQVLMLIFSGSILLMKKDARWILRIGNVFRSRKMWGPSCRQDNRKWFMETALDCKSSSAPKRLESCPLPEKWGIPSAVRMTGGSFVAISIPLVIPVGAVIG